MYSKQMVLRSSAQRPIYYYEQGLLHYYSSASLRCFLTVVCVYRPSRKTARHETTSHEIGSDALARVTNPTKTTLIVRFNTPVP